MPRDRRHERALSPGFTNTTMTTEIELCSAQVLHALSKFAAGPKDIRQHLQGVWIENRQDGCFLWASDGCIVAGLHACAKIEGESFEQIIPWSAISMVPKTKARVSLILGAHEPQLSVNGVRIPFPRSNMRMSPFRQIIPREVTHKSAPFNTEMLDRFRNMAQALGRTKDVAGQIDLFQNGQQNAVVQIPGYPEFLGVIAPIRAKENLQPNIPSWAIQS